MALAAHQAIPAIYPERWQAASGCVPPCRLFCSPRRTRSSNEAARPDRDGGQLADCLPVVAHAQQAERIRGLVGRGIADPNRCGTQYADYCVVINGPAQQVRMMTLPFGGRSSDVGARGLTAHHGFQRVVIEDIGFGRRREALP